MTKPGVSGLTRSLPDCWCRRAATRPGATATRYLQIAQPGGVATRHRRPNPEPPRHNRGQPDRWLRRAAPRPGATVSRNTPVAQSGKGSDSLTPQRSGQSRARTSRPATQRQGHHRNFTFVLSVLKFLVCIGGRIQNNTCLFVFRRDFSYWCVFLYCYVFLHVYICIAMY
jgi:hypothetical protein